MGAAHDLHAGDAGARAAVACRVHSRTMVMRLLHDSAGTWRPDMIVFIFLSRMNSDDPEIANRIYLPTQQQEVIYTRRSEKTKQKRGQKIFIRRAGADERISAVLPHFHEGVARNRPLRHAN